MVFKSCFPITRVILDKHARDALVVLVASLLWGLFLYDMLALRLFCSCFPVMGVIPEDSKVDALIDGCFPVMGVIL